MTLYDNHARSMTLTVVVDNLINIFLPSQGPFTYPQPGRHSSLLGEQGLSLWIEATDAQDRTTRVLYDFGRGEYVVRNNMKLLDIDPATADYMVLSHGHVDHYGGMLRLLDENPISAPLVAHPMAFGTRGIKRADGEMAGPWVLERQKVEEALAVTPIVSNEPQNLAPGLFTSGSIAHTSPLDRPFKAAVRQEDDAWVADEFQDDQAIFVNLQGRGVVVMTGCCHAGLFNTLARSQELFPGAPLYALVGGLHWNFLGEKDLDEVIEALAAYNPQWVLATHCTGALAIHKLRVKFGERCPFNTVGLRCNW